MRHPTKSLALVGLLILTLCGLAYAQDSQSKTTAADIEKYTTWLEEGDAEERIKGSKWVRGHGAGVEDFDERVLPLLEANLQHDDPDVRKWTVLALATRGESALPLLEAALPDETDDAVRNQLKATIRHIKDDIEQREWIENHPCQKLDLAEVKKWKVRKLCDPLGKYPPVIRDLGDGTYLYGSRHRADDECFRGKRKKRCLKRCMPEGTSIATPDGPAAIEALSVGDRIWSLDDDGERVPARVVETGTLPVTDHELIRIVLADDRVVRASASHPTADGRLFGALEAGDVVAGTAVVGVERVPYAGSRTFDIRVDGPTGLYIAEGVPLGSTMHGDSVGCRERTRPSPTIGTSR